MISREQIRYRNFWVRLVCCLFVALVVSRWVYTQELAAWEEVAADLVFRTHAMVRPASLAFQTWLTFCIVLAPSLVYIEQPAAMVGAGIVFAGSYVALAAAFAGYIALPVAAPLLGIVGSSTFLETMAWSEERAKRKKLEALEIVKQQSTDMLVHDLRRRMSTILMSSNLLDKRVDFGDADVRDLLGAIRVSAERILIQIDDILAVRKIEEGKLALQTKHVSLGALLRESLREHDKAAELVGVGIRLADDDAGRNVYVCVDTKVFGRVMANLLWNGLQHAPRGSDIEVGYGIADGRVMVYVANRGKPIAPERQAQLFQAFVSGPQGTDSSVGFGIGLGLAFCKLAVEAHGGGIGIETPWQERGDGVKVTINLPAPIV